jgi:hypothetical protein
MVYTWTDRDTVEGDSHLWYTRDLGEVWNGFA